MKKSRKIYISLFACILMILGVNEIFAGTSKVQGILKSELDNASLFGANVKLTNTKTNKIVGAKSKNDGSFVVENIPNGQYTMMISHVSHKTITRKFDLSKDINFGTIRLKMDYAQTDSINVIGVASLVEQHGDTISYNASAYKTNPDATSEDLITKMPGITVADDGAVSAQGEEVKQVYVDGKTFFGNDPTAVLRTMPAEVVDKIEIFDEQSEQSKFTGFDDGNTTKTINIVTKENMRDGWFGKFYGGYGYEDKYTAGGNINYFNGDTRLTLVALTNNINQQNFSSEDLLGVMSSSGRRRGPGGGGGRPSGEDNFMVNQYGGITNTHSLGLNYSDRWGENIEVAGSYFFNMSDNTSNSSLERQYFMDKNAGQFYTEDNESQTNNTNHRFNFKFDWDINDYNSIMIRPSISMQINDGSETTNSLTTLNGDTLNIADYGYSSELSALNFSNDMLFRHQFLKPMRTASLFLNTKLSNSTGDSWLDSKTIFANQSSDVLNQYADYNNDLYSYSAKIDYTEPLFGFGGGMSMVMVSYTNSFQDNSTGQKTYDFDEDSDEYSFFNQDLSNSFVSDYSFNKVEAGLMYRKSKEFFMMARLGAQYAQLENFQTYPDAYNTDKNFTDVLGMLMGHYTFLEKHKLFLRYRTNTGTPSNSQLQEVIDNSDPYKLTTGNSELEASYSHSLRLRYQLVNPDNANVLMMMLMGTYTNDYIGNNTYLADRDTLIAPGILLPTGGQFSKSENMDGYVRLNSFVTYGLPLPYIKTNLNMNVSANYTRTPSIYDGNLYHSNNSGYGFGVVFASNISEYVDFTISSNSSFNNAYSSINSASNTEYFNQSTRFKLSLLSKSGLFIKTDITHQYYSGLADDYNENYFLWNASIGYKFLKNDRGELKLTAFDILKQNQSIARTVNDLYVEDSITEVLQQYAMLTFTYTIRSFSLSKEEQEMQKHRQEMQKMGARPPRN